MTAAIQTTVSSGITSEKNCAQRPCMSARTAPGLCNVTSFVEASTGSKECCCRNAFGVGAHLLLTGGVQESAAVVGVAGSLHASLRANGIVKPWPPSSCNSSRQASAEGRSSVSLFNNPCITMLSEDGASPHSDQRGSSSMTYKANSKTEPPWNGGHKAHSSKKMHPSAHKSDCTEYGSFLISSGAK